MATKPIKGKAARAVVQGRALASLGGGVMLVRVGRAKPTATRPGDEAAALMFKVGQALKKPGIGKDVVFQGQADIFSYSVYPADVSKVVREAADGTVTVGYVVGGKFRPAKQA